MPKNLVPDLSAETIEWHPEVGKLVLAYEAAAQKKSTNELSASLAVARENIADEAKAASRLIDGKIREARDADGKKKARPVI